MNTQTPPTVSELLRQSADRWPGNEALVAVDGRWTYSELLEATHAAAVVLSGLGVGPGTRVAATSRNRGDLVVSFLAVQHLGAVWIGVNRVLSAVEKRSLLTTARASHVIAEADYAPDVEDLAESVVLLGDQWRDACTSARGEVPAATDGDAPALIAFTSGTSGHPKGIVHSQRNLLLPGASQLGMPWGPRERHGTALALTIVNPMVLGPLLAFHAGATSIAVDRTDARGLAGWIEREQITTLMAVPTILYDLLNDEAVDPSQLTSLRHVAVGGAAPPPSLIARFEDRFGIRPLGSYGLTEAPAVVSIERPGEPGAPGSVGPPVPHLDVDIRSDEGNSVAPGDTGEIVITASTSGPWAGAWTPFLGYVNTDVEQPSDVLATGDMGYLDEAGHLFVVDRKSELILRGGANVYPAEIESVLHDDPRVAACVVVGRSDERLGQVPVAFVEGTAGSTLDADALLDRCRQRLATYKVPVAIVLVTELPKNAMGKVARAEVRALAEREKVESGGR